MRLPARPSLINSTPPWTLGQGWTHASGRRCTPGLIHRMTQGSTLASMSHPAPSGVDITLVVASQKCADGPDQRVPFLSLTELTRPLAEDHEEPGQQSHGWVWRCRDRPPHRRCTRSPSPWACQESAPGMSRWIPPIPVPRTIHPPACCSGSPPPCRKPTMSRTRREEPSRRRRQPPLSLNDRHTGPRNGSTLPSSSTRPSRPPPTASASPARLPGQDSLPR